MEEIKISLSLEKDGSISSNSKTAGFSGGACKTAFAPFNKILGQVVSDVATEEFYNSEQAQVQQGGY